MSNSSPNEQSIRIMCPNLMCQRVLAVPALARGKLVRCKGCGSNIRIPAAKSAAPEPAAGTPAPAEAKGKDATKKDAA